MASIARFLKKMSFFVMCSLLICIFVICSLLIGIFEFSRRAARGGNAAYFGGTKSNNGMDCLVFEHKLEVRRYRFGRECIQVVSIAVALLSRFG